MVYRRDLPPEPINYLDKQQKQTFYEFAQHKVPTNLQNPFTIGFKMVHRQDLPPEPVNYQELKGHLFQKRFCADIEIHIQQHKQEFKFWKSVSSANGKDHQVLGCQWVFKYKNDKHGRL